MAFPFLRFARRLCAAPEKTADEPLSPPPATPLRARLLSSTVLMPAVLQDARDWLEALWRDTLRPIWDTLVAVWEWMARELPTWLPWINAAFDWWWRNVQALAADVTITHAEGDKPLEVAALAVILVLFTAIPPLALLNLTAGTVDLVAGIGRRGWTLAKLPALLGLLALRVALLPLWVLFAPVRAWAHRPRLNRRAIRDLGTDRLLNGLEALWALRHRKRWFAGTWDRLWLPERKPDPAALIVGRHPWWWFRDRLLWHSGERHMLTVAPSRSGKGVGTVIPNLIVYPGPVVVTDIKGELAIATWARRSQFGPVYILDPFRQTSKARPAVPADARFNPLEWLDPAAPDFTDGLKELAELLVPTDKPEGGPPSWWIEGARSLVAAVVALVVISGPRERVHLGTVWDYLTHEFDECKELLAVSQDPYVRAAWAEWSDRTGEGKGTVITALREAMGWLNSPPVRGCLAGASSFRPDDLKRRGGTVYVCLPPDKLELHGRFLRLVIGYCLKDMTRQLGHQGLPALFMLDEFAHLGTLESVRTALGYAAGFGVRLWPIVQDLGQLQQLYGEHDWERFLSAADVTQIFAVDDLSTQHHVSEKLGKRGVAHKVQNTGTGEGEPTGGGFWGFLRLFGRWSRNRGWHWEYRAVDVMSPSEVKRKTATVPARAYRRHWRKERQILLRKDGWPMLAGKVSHWRMQVFEGLWSTGRLTLGQRAAEGLRLAGAALVGMIRARFRPPPAP